MPKKHSGISKDTKRNTWMIHTTISLPNGEYKTITKRGFASERDAFKALEELKKQILKDYQSKLRFISWNDACAEYWHYYEMKVKSTTAGNTFVVYNANIIKPFMNESLETVVRRSNLMTFKNNIVKRLISADHKNRIIRFMRWTLEYHYQRGNITTEEFKQANIILEPISRKNEIKKERPFWTIEQFKAFLKTFDDADKYRILFEVFGHLGCRVSELRGLQVKHYDSKAQTIEIRQQVTSKMNSGSWEIVPPKTKKSNRTITLSNRISKMLSDFIKDMRYQEDDFLFFGSCPVGDSSIRRVLNTHAQKAALPIIPIHSLRHSNATWLLSNPNFNISEIGKISERLGHESKKITLDIYYHLVKDINEDRILDVLP